MINGGTVDSVSITLTRDELLTFLAIMGSSTINGLGDDPLVGLGEEEIENVVEQRRAIIAEPWADRTARRR